MFAFLRGIVWSIQKNPVALDVNGVGYQVFIPERTRSKLAEGMEVTLFTYCYIREDAFQIYGFLSDEERALFAMLLGVNGVGPKLALGVLSEMSVENFLRIVSNGDVMALTGVSGVGKKIAQRIILELKTKLVGDAELSKLLYSDEEQISVGDEVIAALCSLGCTQQEARRALERVRQKLGDDASVEDLVREALRSLSKV